MSITFYNTLRLSGLLVCILSSSSLVNDTWANEAVCGLSESITDRIVMKRTSEEDRPFLESLLLNPIVSLSAGFGILSKPEVKWAVDGFVAPTTLASYTVFLSESPIPIGYFQVCDLKKNRPALDDIAEEYQQDILDTHSLDVGYFVDNFFWNMGYEIEFISGFVNNLKENRKYSSVDKDIQTITSSPFPTDRMNVTILEKAGFVLKGPKQGPRGTVLYTYQFYTTRGHKLRV